MDRARECLLDASLQAFQQVGVAFEHVRLADTDGRVRRVAPARAVAGASQRTLLQSGRMPLTYGLGFDIARMASSTSWMRPSWMRSAGRRPLKILVPRVQPCARRSRVRIELREPFHDVLQVNEQVLLLRPRIGSTVVPSGNRLRRRSKHVGHVDRSYRRPGPQQLQLLRHRVPFHCDICHPLPPIRFALHRAQFNRAPTRRRGQFAHPPVEAAGCCPVPASRGSSIASRFSFDDQVAQLRVPGLRMRDRIRSRVNRPSARPPRRQSPGD